MTNDDSTKRAALYLLKRGLATQSEIAKLSGRSRQIISVWGKDFPTARAEYLKVQWARAMARKR